MPENPLMAGLHRLTKNRAAIGTAIGLAGRFGVQGLVLLSRGYLGPLADRAAERATPPSEPIVVRPDGTAPPVTTRAATTGFAGLSSKDLAILGLAATKLIFEAGELALHNPTLDPAGKQPDFKLDDNGRAPAMSLAHLAAAVRYVRTPSVEPVAETRSAEVQMMVYTPPPAPRTRMYAARSAYYGATPRIGYAASSPTATRYQTASALRAPASAPSRTGASMSSSRGCGTCGGSHATPPAPTPTFDPCARGLPAPPRAPEGGCGCGGRSSGGCSCGSKSTAVAKTRTYDSEQCPTFAISCETKEALRDCVKVAVCNFLQCFADTLCPDGRFDSDVFKNPEICKQLVDCVGQLACSFMHCVPDALCGPKCDALPAPIDCVPCDYAVEVVR